MRYRAICLVEEKTDMGRRRRGRGSWIRTRPICRGGWSRLSLGESGDGFDAREAGSGLYRRISRRKVWLAPLKHREPEAEAMNIDEIPPPLSALETSRRAPDNATTFDSIPCDWEEGNLHSRGERHKPPPPLPNWSSPHSRSSRELKGVSLWIRSRHWFSPPVGHSRHNHRHSALTTSGFRILIYRESRLDNTARIEPSHARRRAAPHVTPSSQVPVRNAASIILIAESGSTQSSGSTAFLTLSGFQTWQSSHRYSSSFCAASRPYIAY